MKKRKGFTLIELLAVIVVLAIILAIAVPTIGNVIKNSTRNAFEIDAKMVLKAVDYKRLKNEKFDPLVVTKDNMMEQIGIDSSQYAQVTFKAKEKETEMILVGAGKWDGLIAYGTIDNMIIVNSGDYDETPPAITILGDNPIIVDKNTVYADAGATATDLKDGNVPLTSTVIKNINGTVVGTVDTSTFTMYTITYTAVDSQGNIGSAARQIIIADKTAPVITILGSNPANINVGGTYTDAGATALDETDGNVTSKIVVTGTVNPSIVGTYTITYTVKDLANNQTTVTRTVNVLDNVIPTVAFGTNGNATYAKSRSTTVTVSDNVSVNASSLKYQWTTSTTAPTEASFSTTFTNGGTISTPAGVTGGYYLWILAKDTNNNTMIARSNVFNLDNTKPIITLNGNSTVTINKGSTYSDAGATASDAHSGVAGSVTATGTVNPSIVGTYTITYNVNDNAGNAATPVTRTVNVIDVTAPVITILGSNPASINLGGTYSDAGATATDDVDGNVTSRIVTTGAVNPGAIGTYSITYTVKDNANNQAVATRTVYVLDSVPPTVAFGTNGNATYAKSRSTTVTVSDNVSVNTSSLKYQWTTSTTTPTEASFSTTFTNGGTISTPAGATGGYYLWILAKDTNNNTMINRSNLFNIDNTPPTLTINGNSPISTNAGGTYSDAGASAVDAHSGVAGSVAVTSNVNPSVVGTYTVTYNVSDNAGNVAIPATRTVQVFNVINDFYFTGGVQTVVVPIDVTKAIFEVWGAAGNVQSGLTCYDGGETCWYGRAGGYAKGTFDVTPGQTLYVYVGGNNGWNGGAGGGGGYWGGGNGGGASDIRPGGTTLNDRVIVAGGGGGNNGGGSGGGTSGADGPGRSYDTDSGTGGTQTSGGYGGTDTASGGNGGFGYGGGGGSGNYTDYGTGGGGGGGGWYGGGGGAYPSGSAGGGSGYIKPGATDTSMQTGVRGGNGAARVTFVLSTNYFAYTGTVQQYVTKTPRVMIELWGAQGTVQGGLTCYDGGETCWYGRAGGYARGIFNVGTGQTLYIYVGGQNGWNGGGCGGAGFWIGGTGGGASDVRIGGTALTNRIIVAGGGGGNNGAGGGGGTSGADGPNRTYSYSSGTGGTQTSGGYGGSDMANGGNGSLGQGGCGGSGEYSNGNPGGGGGGGGYYGGGGGAYPSGAGGGGSGYIRSDATVTEMQTGVHGGNGYVRITDLN